LLCTRNCKRTLEIRLRFRCIRLRRLKRDLACNTMDLGFGPDFLCCFNGRYGLTDAALGRPA
jgi:hypothetical protein